MSSNSRGVYPTAPAPVHLASSQEGYDTATGHALWWLRRQPELAAQCRITAGGIAEHEWVRTSKLMQRLKWEVKPRKQEDWLWRKLDAAQEYMEGERAAMKAAFEENRVRAALRGGLVHRLYSVLTHIGRSAGRMGGPNVMASHLGLVDTIADVFGEEHRPTSKAITWAGRELEDMGLLTRTPGVYGQGFKNARTTVYRLLGRKGDPNYVSPACPPAGRAYVVEGGEGAAGDDAEAVSRTYAIFARAVQRLREARRAVYRQGGFVVDKLAEMSQGEDVPQADLDELLSPPGPPVLPDCPASFDEIMASC
jgi:hypothetical protein